MAASIISIIFLRPAASFLQMFGHERFNLIKILQIAAFTAGDMFNHPSPDWLCTFNFSRLQPKPGDKSVRSIQGVIHHTVMPLFRFCILFGCQWNILPMLNSNCLILCYRMAFPGILYTPQISHMRHSSVTEESQTRIDGGY